MKRVVLGLLTFFCLSFSVYAEEVDIIIFTGQSNMVGIGAQSISDDEMNYLNFSLLKGKVYEYKYAEDKIIEYNTSNNIEEKEEIIEEVVEVEDDVIENISDDIKENLDNDETENNDSNNLEDKNSYDIKQEDDVISNDKEKEDNSNSKDISLMSI